MKVTVVIPDGTTDDPAAGSDERAWHEIDRFAATLARALGHDVPIIDPAAAEMPGDGVVVAFDAELLRRSPSIVTAV
jgi:hypothetical protein